MRSRFALEPASGLGEREAEPRRAGGDARQPRSRCSSVPCRAITLPAIAVAITSFAAGKPPGGEALGRDAELEHAARAAVLLRAATAP